ncbi:MAG TPA: AAA domain-containing protein [Flavisolibacter sp.]|nr:AAA domain-containing protein [Flavisolibacter sp.]
MDYFRRLLHLLKVEKEEDKASYQQLIENQSVINRRENGMTWYPVAIKDTELGHADYLDVEVERTTHTDIIHQFRFGMSVALFSNHDPREDRIEGTVTYISGNKMKFSLRTDELPDWSRNGKLGVDIVFDEASYYEMENALKQAPLLAEKREEGLLVNILTGNKKPGFNTSIDEQPLQPYIQQLNSKQQMAVQRIITANELAIVHGPPGTGKTTTLVQAIKCLVSQEHEQVLVVAPSNTAVDLLTEKLSAEGLNVVRVGNPARVSERLMSMTLDQRIAVHPAAKEIRRLKKQASEYRDMAHKYKRNFGKEEREQRKALFAEARNINKEVERTEQYIIDDTLAKANVITATLVGANHYTVRSRKYKTVVIDEAGQALEPACWIPILKARKLVMAGDHYQLPPTIKSEEAARDGLNITLLEKAVSLHPEAVVLLEEQYRMHETIMGFSSREFYEGKLKADPSVARRVLFEGDSPLLFIDTAGCGFEEKWEGTSISNPEEAGFLLKQLLQLMQNLKMKSQPPKYPSIGVISPYKHQVETLREAVKEGSEWNDYREYITVNTIDSFQGQERDAIFISMTRSNADSIIGFLSEIRRMNVAMTRARKKLVVVGDSATLSQSAFYADFIAYAQQENAYISAWELMDW